MIREEAGFSDLFFVNVSTILKHPSNIPSENEIEMVELSFPHINRKKVRDVAPHPILQTMYILSIKKIHANLLLTHFVKNHFTKIFLQSYFNISKLSSNNFLQINPSEVFYFLFFCHGFTESMLSAKVNLNYILCT